MTVIYYTMCIVLILYYMYSVVKWYGLRAALWVDANWRKRDNFIDTYQLSSEASRAREELINNRARLLLYKLKRKQ